MNKEEGASHVAMIYKKAVDGEAEIIMNKVNLLEVYYGYLKEDGEEFAEQHFENICNSIIKISDVISDEIMRQAGKIKNVYKISLADSFAIAQAIVSDAVLVTSDHHELDAVEIGTNIKFQWIR
jgi:predicted nucleic acid-binding protein